ncbi:Oidioi.mRNA.OKI2018_I69.XSR.g15515.t1.cds [Oikopleura dioica]|uniref:Oidioi.mRNA.OKI2018_I69.XSR.g15515.t1.cds n=1 Tax=Oikopleura dioica TaxID=34765 RepID=A0ABN7SD45_OIKDI|nr:Oidioi.mRNA.OKI2018_I69.XSR.g15515.t1.cds [Oikopleura dioica]
MEWDSSFGDDKSFIFAMMKAEIEDALGEIFADRSGYNGLEVTSFSAGSIIADVTVKYLFQDYRKNSFEQETFLSQLEEQTKEIIKENKDILKERRLDVSSVDIVRAEYEILGKRPANHFSS